MFFDKKMGMEECCSTSRPMEYPQKNEVKVETLINNKNNNKISKIDKKQIIKIQSYYRGMKVRKKLKKQLSTSSYFISNETNINFAEISSQEYKNLIKLYPQIISNNKNIKIIENKLLNNKELYYGEYDIFKKSKEGRGILVTQEGSKYWGYFKNDKKNIKGKLKHYEGDIYEGEWLDDMANGKGKYIHIDGTIYDGGWKNDKQEGFGIETWNDGSYYEGNYVNGKKEGKGKYKWSDGSSYEGEFKGNAINGKGKYIWNNKRIYEGDWVNNKMMGHGVFIWPDGRKYKGAYIDDKKEGYGVYYWPDGRIYEGMWKDGHQNGEGVLFDPNINKKRKGLWKNGKKIKWLE